MQSFFLRLAKSKLLTTTLFTAMICAIVATFISINSYSRWEHELAQFQSFTPTKIALCKDLEKEAQSLGRNWRSIESKISVNNCSIKINVYSSSRLPELYLPKNPGSYFQFLLNATDFGKLFYFLTFVLIFSWLTTQIIHDLLKIEQQGWKRLFIVISVIAMIISIWKFRDEYSKDFVLHLIINLLVLVGTTAALVYGRIIFNWVADGFAKQQPSSSKSESKPTKEIHSKAIETTMIPLERPAVVIADPLPKPTTSERLPFATYWPRFWARCIDLFLVMVIANIISIFIPDLPISPGMGAILTDAIIWMILLSIVIVAYDKFLIQKYGTTLGKAAFGLQVRSLNGGGLLTSSQAQGRAFSHLKSGLYFMIYFPVLQFIAAINIWRKRDEPMPWDREANSVVLQKPIGQLRYLSFTLVALALILSVIAANMVFKQMRKVEFRESATEYMKR